MERTLQPNRTVIRNKGSVSHLLLFIVLVLMANHLIFSPNSKMLLEQRAEREKSLQSDKARLVAVTLAQKTQNLEGTNTIIIPPAALNADGAPMNGALPSDGGRLPAVATNITSSSMRYCPYLYVSDGDPLPGYIIKSIGDTSELTDDKILFSLINDAIVTNKQIDCAAAAEMPGNKTKVYNVTIGEARKLVRGLETEDATTNLTATGCQPGEQVRFVPSANGSPAAIRCERQIANVATVGGGTPAAGAPLSASATTGLAEAAVDPRTIQALAKTTDYCGERNAANSCIGPKEISVYDISQYLNGVPVASGNATVDLGEAAAGIDCPAPRYDNGIYYEGGVMVRNAQGTYTCVNGRGVFTSARGYNGAAICPPGKRVVYNGNRGFACEGVALTDLTYGQMNICGSGQLFGYSPETNSLYCYSAPAGQQASAESARLVTYYDPERVIALRDETQSAGNEDRCGVLVMRGGTADCSGENLNSLYQTQMVELGDAASTAGIDIHQNLAFNWDPANKVLIALDARTVNANTPQNNNCDSVPGLSLNYGQDSNNIAAIYNLADQNQLSDTLTDGFGGNELLAAAAPTNQNNQLQWANVGAVRYYKDYGYASEYKLNGTDAVLRRVTGRWAVLSPCLSLENAYNYYNSENELNSTLNGNVMNPHLYSYSEVYPGIRVNDFDAAKQSLFDDGWVLNANGDWERDGDPASSQQVITTLQNRGGFTLVNGLWVRS